MPVSLFFNCESDQALKIINFFGLNILLTTMNFMLSFEPAKLQEPITYRDKILLTGSCFTEHIGNALKDAKFSIIQNPHGILFDPISVCRSLISYTIDKQYNEDDLFQLNEVWNSWQHHSRYSHIDREKALQQINASQAQAHEFLKKAEWIVITFGSSFSYRLTDLPLVGSASSGDTWNNAVANCHRAPAQWFHKHLLGTGEIIEALDLCMHHLLQFNPGLKIIFTISPVRHLRDGVVENNRSKARLIESVHHMVGKFDRLFYFPAYELVIDVLRDYRFYDIDLAHPNYMATDFVLQKFVDSCLDEEARLLVDEMKKINLARRHKPFQPATEAHRQFLRSSAAKAAALKIKFPFLDLADEIEYFNSAHHIIE